MMSMKKYEALGLIETFGIVFVLEAADAMCKAADVDLIGFENVASGYISVLVSGDVGACRTAVEAGVRAVNEMGAEVYSSVRIWKKLLRDILLISFFQLLRSKV